MTGNKQLTASLEDYIESIYNIALANGAARVTDIAADLGVAKSSVTGALRNLSLRGLVNYDPYSVITLTDEGQQAAERVVKRHSVLARFLEEVLGVPAESAQANACRLEHAMEPVVVDRLRKFVEFIERCPRAGDELRAGFERYYEGVAARISCTQCLSKALDAAIHGVSFCGGAGDGQSGENGDE